MQLIMSADQEATITMNRDDFEEVVRTTIESVLNARANIDSKTHKKHHEFIDAYLEERERKKEFWRDIRKRIIGWAIIVAITGFGIIVYDWLVAFIARGGR